ncbi:hypothetical protein PVAP13_5NG247281 [Panicum virgatum]|uniref:Uncharacterized protein n=1 Tax=Panicum virgatum TaxID=38727 RepID=A0A8T0RUU8_PANVG|nr:hypothetical protein PVAP13_5NG247281 [Panicum virgatum]
MFLSLHASVTPPPDAHRTPRRRSGRATLGCLQRGHVNAPSVYRWRKKSCSGVRNGSRYHCGSRDARQIWRWQWTPATCHRGSGPYASQPPRTSPLMPELRWRPPPGRGEADGERGRGVGTPPELGVEEATARPPPPQPHPGPPAAVAAQAHGRREEAPGGREEGRLRAAREDGAARAAVAAAGCACAAAAVTGRARTTSPWPERRKRRAPAPAIEALVAKKTQGRCRRCHAQQLLLPHTALLCFLAAPMRPHHRTAAACRIFTSPPPRQTRRTGRCVPQLLLAAPPPCGCAARPPPPTPAARCAGHGRRGWPGRTPERRARSASRRPGAARTASERGEGGGSGFGAAREEEGGARGGGGDRCRHGSWPRAARSLPDRPSRDRGSPAARAPCVLGAAGRVRSPLLRDLGTAARAPLPCALGAAGRPPHARAR